MRTVTRPRSLEAALPQYLPAFALERALGDPGHPGNTLSTRQSLRRDEATRFPETALAVIHAMGLASAFVPEHVGGRPASVETLMAVSRVVARRDMAAAVACCGMLGGVWAWIGANPVQQRQVAQWILDKRSACFSPCEEAQHGSDGGANALTAHKAPGDRNGYLLNGQAWPVNLASRADFMVLLARTGGAHPAPGHTLFIVDKATLPARALRCLPKATGMRGCDIGGIDFTNCPVPEAARVGAQGEGLEVLLKGFQVTSVHGAALSLGLGDSALRLAAAWVAERRDDPLHGPMGDALADAYLSLLMAECVAVVAARGLHLHTAQFSSWSAVVHVQVGQLVAQAIRTVSGVLGQQALRREDAGEGLFQKLLRDNGIVPFLGGSKTFCMDRLSRCLPVLARRRSQGRERPGAGDAQALFDLRSPLPALPFDRLEPDGPGGDAVLDNLPGLLNALQLAHADADAHAQNAMDTHSPACQPSTWQALQRGAAALTSEWAEMEAALLGEPADGREGRAPSAAWTERYVELHGAVAALGVWLHNRQTLGGFFAEGRWLCAVLERVTVRGAASAMDPRLATDLHKQLDDQCLQGRMLSLLDWPLAAAGSVEAVQAVF
jgi:alkylation response protein AidB-like acyl-CoA dehydrogenase